MAKKNNSQTIYKLMKLKRKSKWISFYPIYSKQSGNENQKILIKKKNHYKQQAPLRISRIKWMWKPTI